jgi:LPS export ABC transporter protein LptC
MRSSTYKKHHLLKFFLLAVILTTLGAIIAIYITFRQVPKTPERVLAPIQQAAKMSIGKIHQTATRDGRKQWSLEASSAHYIEQNDRLILKNLAVTFYLEDKSEVYLTADHGILKTDSNDIEVTGNVVLKNKKYKLITENLNYSHAQRVLYSNAPVTISGDTAKLAADSLAFDLNTKGLVLEGSVEATIAENFTL